jgi:tetratricopeptide (TPR) repeat protein
MTGCLMLLALMGTSVQATEMTRAFLDGITHYKENNFAEAISEFSKIVETGVKNSKLFYNLGNAYLKNDDLGHAILWYERALRLTPDDPDLKFNHEYAISQVRDEREDKSLSVFRILFFWKHALSAKTVQWTAISLNLIFWLIVTVRMIQRKKRILKTPGYLLMGLILVFMFTACYNYYEVRYLRQAVILPAEVSVRSGLADEATELFVLHAGTKVRIEKEHEGFFRIFFSEGKIGWLRRADAGII